uniref:Uncharacterized protein n=1 Tax=Anopheles farauti TaxID=69004 RepID=A0A182QEM7_9DIPT
MLERIAAKARHGGELVVRKIQPHRTLGQLFDPPPEAVRKPMPPAVDVKLRKTGRTGIWHVTVAVLIVIQVGRILQRFAEVTQMRHEPSGHLVWQLGNQPWTLDIERSAQKRLQHDGVFPSAHISIQRCGYDLKIITQVLVVIVVALVRMERRLAGVLLLHATLLQHFVNLRTLVILLECGRNRFQLQVSFGIDEVFLLEETLHETFRRAIVGGQIAVAQLRNRLGTDARLGHALERKDADHFLLAQRECLGGGEKNGKN